MLHMKSDIQGSMCVLNGVYYFSCCFLAAYLPSQAVALAVVVAKVTHLAVHDVYPCFAHILPHAVIAGQLLRMSADVCVPIGFVFVGAIGGRVPTEDLQHEKTETNRFTRWHGYMNNVGQPCGKQSNQIQVPIKTLFNLPGSQSQ